MGKLFKDKYSFEQRSGESGRIKEKYPDRIPIIVYADHRSGTVPDIDKNKFLVPSNLTFGQFLYIIRKRIKLDSKKAIFMFINNIMPNSSSSLSSLHEEHKDDDGFLYCIYSGESVYGW
jgi:GABA(A) receptor-associated protein